jgi:predicted RND superfamily exporter protein
MSFWAKMIFNHRKKILSILLIITMVFAFGATQIESGFNFYSFLPEDSHAVQTYLKINENLPFIGEDQEYIFLEGNVATVATIQGLKETHDNFEDDIFIGRNVDGTSKTESIYTIIKQACTINETLISEFNLDENTFIPQSDNDVENLYDYLSTTLEYGLQTQTLIHKAENGKYDASIVRVYIDIVSAGQSGSDLEKNLERMTNELNEDLADYGDDVDAIVTGFFVITHVITSSLTDSQMFSTAISLVLATIVLIIAYRKPLLGIIAMLPVLISIVWILGTMTFIDYSLNILTISVTSLTIGIGVDYAIHVTERFKIVADKTGDIELAVRQTIEKTGGALLIAALTTTLGFGMLILAPIPPQQQFGVIMVMTIAYSLFTSILFLPLILARWAKWRKKRIGYIISSKPTDEDYFNEIVASNNKIKK